MPLPAFARAIRTVRRSLGLTQTQLAMRVGIKACAVWRWEHGRTTPSRRHRRALLTAVQAVDPSAAQRLQAALGGTAATGQTQGLAVAPPVTPDPSDLQFALMAMADELDLSPRRLRVSLEALLGKLGRGNFSVESARAQLAAWRTPVPELTAR